MTGFERTMRTLKGQATDRVPMMLHSFMPAAAEAGYSMEAYRTSPTAIADAHLRFAEKYGMDGILIDIDTCLEASAIGVPVDYPMDEPARVTGGLSNRFDVLRGAMDADMLLQSERIGIALEAVRIAKEKVGNDLLVRGNCDQAGFSLAMLAFGMHDFFMVLTDPEIEQDILDLIDRATDFHIAFHRLMRQAGADVTSFGDSSCGPDLISPEMYRKFALPSHKRIAAEARMSGVPTVCHICGNLDKIIADVAGAGFTGIEVDYKTDIPRAQGILGEQNVVMFGPLDPSGVFYYGSPKKVREETQKVLLCFGGKGLVIGAGCALPKGTLEENIKAFADSVLNG